MQQTDEEARRTKLRLRYVGVFSVRLFLANQAAKGCK